MHIPLLRLSHVAGAHTCLLGLRTTYLPIIIIIIIIIIEGLSLLQSIPPTTTSKQTQAQKRRGSRARKLLGAKLKLKATG